MANNAYTNIIAFGDINAINKYRNLIQIKDYFLDLNAIAPIPNYFSQDYIKASAKNQEEFDEWRLTNWGMRHFPIVHSEAMKIFPMELGIHSIKLETRYCPPFGTIDRISSISSDLDFLVEIEYDYPEKTLEYYDNKNNKFHTLLQTQDLIHFELQGLPEAESVEINNSFCKALSLTGLGKTYLDLKFPEGIPFPLCLAFDK